MLLFSEAVRRVCKFCQQLALENIPAKLIKVGIFYELNNLDSYPVHFGIIEGLYHLKYQYYVSIMPDAPDIVSCLKLCRHNPTDPNCFLFGRIPSLYIVRGFALWQNQIRIHSKPILGDPGATSRDDAILYFWAKVYFKSCRAPGNLFLPNQFQKTSNSIPLIGQKNIISDEVQPGNSVAFLHEVVFFIGRLCCLARATGRLSGSVSEKKYSTKPRKSQALT